jgi:L-alanine-DL-glutamate epimerase-like enolase superfamily enzyme
VRRRICGGSQRPQHASVTNSTTIASVETLACDAGWRNYYFVKITTSDGVTGWSEYDESFGNPGITSIINQLRSRIVGRPLGAHEKLHWELFYALRPGTGGVIGQALGAIENALLDAKAKTLGLPCYELLGGKLRDRVQVYWSHCATWRINRQPHYEPLVRDVEGVRALGHEVHDRGFKALKTNIYTYENDVPRGWAPGFGLPFRPELNVTPTIARGLREHIEIMQDAAGPDVEVLLDLNFNARTEGYIRIARELEGLHLLWLEMDTFHAPALADVRRASPHPIASGETLWGLQQFLPFFEQQAIDVAIVDLVWNGAWQSMKIAAAAEAHELNVAPHNFYGHLATMMNAHFAAAVPNLRIFETDVDRIAADSQIFTHEPQIEDGYLVIPDRPGWGTEPNEDVVRSRPPNEYPYGGGLFMYGQKQP